MATAYPSGLTDEQINERVTKLLSIAEECDTIDDLRNLFKRKDHFSAYNGFEPSGRIHIAQAVLTVLNANKIQECNGTFKIYIADWFAKLNHKMDGDLEKIKTLGKYFIEVFNACGINQKGVEYYWASDVITKSQTYWPMVLDISTRNTVKRIMRCSQIMGRSEGDGLSCSQLIYPCMQCTDIFELGVDVCQLGVDQRKVNMLAREYAAATKRQSPVILSHHMLMGLKGAKAGKMSKSIPDSAIFMDDSYDEIKRKVSKAFCNDEVVDNPIYDYLRYIIVPFFGKVTLCGKEYTLADLVPKYGEKMADGKTKKIAKDEFAAAFKAMDKRELKNEVSDYINKIIEPVRKHFDTPEGKKLLETIRSYNTTR